MAPTTQATATQTATIGTEHTLADVAVAGTFQLKVDASALTTGDILELRVYSIVRTGGTRGVEYSAVWYDAQTDDVIKASVPVGNDLTDAGSLRFTLKQTAGTGRAFPWKVLNYG
jgi:hypothetical protein